MYMKDIYQG